MLEAVDTDLVFTISLKRSTQNLPLSTSSPADYPIFWPKADIGIAKCLNKAWSLLGICNDANSSRLPSARRPRGR
jgi:hypothetical protein